MTVSQPSHFREIPEEPPADIRYRRITRLGPSFRELWGARGLVATLAEREIRVRYKQSVLGMSWSVITPVLLMLVFTFFFQAVVDVDTGGAPYAIFSYLGLLPWTFFSSSLSTGGQSLVVNSNLLNKVYCPREVFPLSSVGVAGVDSVIATTILGVLFLVYGYGPKATSVWVPVLLLVQIMYTLGVTLIVSALLVYFRDLRQALPMALQLGLIVTPVAYGDVIPESYRLLFAVLNPLGPVIDGYRRVVLDGQAPDWGFLGPAAVSSLVLFLGGYKLFKRLETHFADVA